MSTPDEMALKGIQFVTDGSGKKTGVLIDLREHEKLWEDFYDGLIAEERKDDPRVPWTELKATLDAGE